MHGAFSHRFHQTLSEFWFSNSPVALEGKGTSRFLSHAPGVRNWGWRKAELRPSGCKLLSISQSALGEWGWEER